jgi:hypothetical protein
MNKEKWIDLDKNKRCAPSKKFKDGSCFTREALQKIANAYNQKLVDKRQQINVSSSKEQLVRQIGDILKNKCNDQVCWLRDNIIKSLDDDDILNNTFRPEGPSGKYEWLSTIDINDVLTQYHEKYDDFIFLGAVPYDFLDLPVLELHHHNLFDNYELQGKTKIGAVINLDTHNMPGSHWVALYTDLEKKQVYFFDSVGKKPGKRIRKFVNKIVKYLYKKINPRDKLEINSLIKSIKNKNYDMIDKLSPIDIRYNYIQHQFDDSECGVYSMNFIINLLEGRTFDDIIHNITKDDAMNRMRTVYFNNI